MRTRSVAWREEHDALTALVVALFEEHHDAVCAYLSGLVADQELAFELAQETFLRVFRARQHLPVVANQRAWVYRIATNLAWDALRRRRLIRWLPWRKVEPERIADPDPGVRFDQHDAVAQALAGLPAAYRAPLLLYDAYGFSTTEIAQTLGISAGAVRTRLYRAREMFRKVYTETQREETQRRSPSTGSQG